MTVNVKARLAEDFGKYGLELVDFYINRITPPEDVQKMIDERAGMRAVGDLDKFFKYKASKAMGDVATSGGSPRVSLLGMDEMKRFNKNDLTLQGATLTWFTFKVNGCNLVDPFTGTMIPQSLIF